MSKKTTSRPHLFIWLFVLGFALAIIFGYYRSVRRPASVYLIAPVSDPVATSIPKPTEYLTPVATIIPAPSSTAIPVLTTPPAPSTQVCAQVVGTCVGRTKSCTTYSDSCQQALVCAVPYQACGIAAPKPGVSSFSASKSCGNASFLDIKFSCTDGRNKVIATNLCTDLLSSLSTALSTCTEVAQ